jgi:hypothetical protein
MKDMQFITLSDGRKATWRKGKGRDLLAASRMAGGNEPMRIAFGLIAVLVSVDGKALTIEDVEDLDMADVLALQGQVMGNAASLGGSISLN